MLVLQTRGLSLDFQKDPHRNPYILVIPVLSEKLRQEGPGEVTAQLAGPAW